MNESPFTSSVAEQATETEPDSGSRRRTAVLAGVLAAAVLGAGGFFLLGGDDAAEPELAGAGGVAAAAAPAAAASQAALPVASKVELGRNPFKALYVQPAAAPVTAPTTAPASGAGTPGRDTGGVNTGGGGTTGGGGLPSTGSPQTPTTGSQPPAAPIAPIAPAKQQVTLVSATHVGEEHTAVFRINGVDETVKVGATFGPSKHLLLLSLQQGPRDDQWTAVVQLGDGDPFDVVTGTPVVVQ